MLNLQNLKRIPTPEEYELEKAYEALRLNGVPMYVEFLCMFLRYYLLLQSRKNQHSE